MMYREGEGPRAAVVARGHVHEPQLAARNDPGRHALIFPPFSPATNSVPSPSWCRPSISTGTLLPEH